LEYKDVRKPIITEFWRDGRAFCAIIHSYAPDCMNWQEVREGSTSRNCLLAFSVAEKEFGVPALLDVQDMLSSKSLDRLSIVTYLSELYHALEKRTGRKQSRERKISGDSGVSDHYSAYEKSNMSTTSSSENISSTEKERNDILAPVKLRFKNNKNKLRLVKSMCDVSSSSEGESSFEAALKKFSMLSSVCHLDHTSKQVEEQCEKQGTKTNNQSEPIEHEKKTLKSQGTQSVNILSITKDKATQTANINTEITNTKTIQNINPDPSKHCDPLHCFNDMKLNSLSSNYSSHYITQLYCGHGNSDYSLTTLV